MDQDRLDLLREKEGFVPRIQQVPKDDLIMGKIFPELSEYSDAALRSFFISWDRLGLLEPLGVVEDDVNFDFAGFLRGKRWSLPKQLYLMYCLDSIDRVDTDHFCENFPYFWYPVCDDLFVCSGDFDWRLEICHDGTILGLRSRAAYA